MVFTDNQKFPDEFFVIIISFYILKYLLETLILKRHIWTFFLLKIHKNYPQFHEISKGHLYKVSPQKGHLRVTDKRKSTYKNFVSA